MPLFGHRKDTSPSPPPPPPVEEPKSHGLFSRNRNTSVERNEPVAQQQSANTSRTGSIFSRRSDPSTTMSSNDHYSDASVVAARDRVHSAELAESEADKALDAARRAVKEARQHVKNIEREAEIEARRAKAKQAESRLLSKDAKSLGRYGPM